MKQERLLIGGIPAVIYGEKSNNVYLFVHGQGGNKEEAESFAEIVSLKGFQVLSIDLPEHGEREKGTNSFYPWIIVPELQKVWEYISKRWQHISIRTNSIGAWYSMLAFSDNDIERSLFVSPILDMEHLIHNMMQWAGVTEDELSAKKTIQTDFGQTLSWKYLFYAKEHAITQWNCDTRILYADKDNLTERCVADSFADHFHCALTVMENGEHWFHTEEQLSFLNIWERENG